MICYAVQNNLSKPFGGNSGAIPSCVATPFGFFIGDCAMYNYKALKIKGKRIDEHRLIMQQHLGRTLSPDEVIHHIDSNGKNNAIENLRLMTKEEHSRKHILQRGNAHLKRPIVHGTTSGYRRGCRCSECKEQHRIRNKNWRERVGK